MKIPFKPGVRVRPKARLTRSFPNLWGARGTVVGLTRDRQCRRVKWDHLKTPVAYHSDYLDYASNSQNL